MFDNHSRWETEFTMGDWVLMDGSNLSIPGICKFRLWFVGLFVITAGIGDVAYCLDLEG